MLTPFRNLLMAGLAFNISANERLPDFYWEQICTATAEVYQHIGVSRLPSWQSDVLCFVPGDKGASYASMFGSGCKRDWMVSSYEPGDPFSDCAFAELGYGKAVAVSIRPESAKGGSSFDVHTGPENNVLSGCGYVVARGDRIAAVTGGQSGRFYYVSEARNRLGVLDTRAYMNLTRQETASEAPSDVAAIPWTWIQNGSHRAGQLVTVVSKKQNTLSVYFFDDNPVCATAGRASDPSFTLRGRRPGSRGRKITICQAPGLPCTEYEPEELPTFAHTAEAREADSQLNEAAIPEGCPAFSSVITQSLEQPDHVELTVHDDGSARIYVTSEKANKLSMFVLARCGELINLLTLNYNAPGSLAVLGAKDHDQVFLISEANNDFSAYQIGGPAGVLRLSGISESKPTDIAAVNDGDKPVVYLATASGIKRYQGSTTGLVSPSRHPVTSALPLPVTSTTTTVTAPVPGNGCSIWTDLFYFSSGTVTMAGTLLTTWLLKEKIIPCLTYKAGYKPI